MFFGEYEHSIDQKGRLRIPSKLKAALGQEKAYLSYGVNGCLYIFPEKQLSEIFEKLDTLSMTETPETKGLRKWSSSINVIEEDNQGRFVLGPQLKRFAQVEKQVVFIGVGRRIELWSKENWIAYNSVESFEDFDKDFNKLTERGI